MLLIKTDTEADVNRIAASSLYRGKDGKSALPTHEGRKGIQRHFGTEAHISVGSNAGLVHNATGKTCNVKDLTQGFGLWYVNTAQMS